jgi:hypothetical protein
MGLNDPDEVAYMAFNFPEDNQTLSYSIEKLDDLSKTLPAGKGQEKAKKWLRTIT